MFASRAQTAQLKEFMVRFAERTGLTEGMAPPRRYLWTDAFAVCNFLELLRRTGEERYLDDAVQLVNQVHQILGRHREDDTRQGWISGLDEQEGEAHPTLGGLRIGKKLNERSSDDPVDDRLEWDRDGQYFHYLTKWMHALDRLAVASGDCRFRRWARELAKAAHAGFCYTPDEGGPKRLYWKMSIDLTYPLVPSMGRHDPLDGLITYRQLESGVMETGEKGASLDLETEIAEMTEICRGMTWVTHDPLGVGGLLMDACRLAQLIARFSSPEKELLSALLGDAESSLAMWAQSHSLFTPAYRRLAFRELGLSIGLHGIGMMRALFERHRNRFPKPQELEARLESLARFEPVIEVIEEFWLKAENQQSASWNAHHDINSVMLATSLGPEAFLTLD